MILQIIPCWKRPEITKLALESIKEMGLMRLWILSPNDPELDKLREVLKGEAYLLINNLPLGRKSNQAIKYALKNIDFDYLMNWGSDNIQSGLLELYGDYIGKHKYFGIDNVYFYSQYYDTCKVAERYNTGCPLGVGRMIHRDYLEQLNGELYPDEQNAGMDGASHERLKEIDPGFVIETNRPYIVDIKTATNINTWNFLKRYKDVDVQILKDYGLYRGRY